MRISRRNLLIASALPGPLSTARASAVPHAALPARADFPPMASTYLDSGTMHPVSIGARHAIERYLDYRSFRRTEFAFDLGEKKRAVLSRFATLINASVAEVCFVPSTTAGENLVTQALNIPASGGRIVTDALHFGGSLYLYSELAKRGMDVVILRPRAWRIELSELEAAVNKNTKLVAVSLISTFNGHCHDLKRVCEIAHANGALVYADVIHAAGAVPFDVRESGVDFAACASYKWLMGDMGLGFLYVKEKLLPQLRRPWFGYQQVASGQTHVYPYDPPGPAVATYTTRDDTAGHFEMGTMANAVLAHLDYSLEYLLTVGVRTIEAYREPMLRKLERELPRMGFEPLTPEASTAPLIAFASKDAQSLAPRLQAAKVRILLAKHHIRISPSVFNDMGDIDSLLNALS